MGPPNPNDPSRKKYKNRPRIVRAAGASSSARSARASPLTPAPAPSAARACGTRRGRRRAAPRARVALRPRAPSTIRAVARRVRAPRARRSARRRGRPRARPWRSPTAPDRRARSGAGRSRSCSRRRGGRARRRACRTASHRPAPRPGRRRTRTPPPGRGSGGSARRRRRGRRGNGDASPISSDRLLDERRQFLDRSLSLLALRRWEVVASLDPSQLAPQPPQRPPWLTRRLRLRVSRVGDYGGVVVSNRLGHARRELAFLPSRRKLAHPDRRLAACLDNLIRQPLELLAITRIERKRS